MTGSRDSRPADPNRPAGPAPAGRRDRRREVSGKHSGRQSAVIVQSVCGICAAFILYRHRAGTPTPPAGDQLPRLRRFTHREILNSWKRAGIARAQLLLLPIKGKHGGITPRNGPEWQSHAVLRKKTHGTRRHFPETPQQLGTGARTIPETAQAIKTDLAGGAQAGFWRGARYFNRAGGKTAQKGTEGA